jgi:hypothetical protein
MATPESQAMVFCFPGEHRKDLLIFRGGVNLTVLVRG